MFPFKYSFFDYKYNIAGYEGQDFDGPARFIYLGVSVVLLVVLLIIFRKAKRENIRLYLRIMGIAMTTFYLIKTVWESVYDIGSGRGFNEYLLPFDTCSLVMWAGLLAGFAKGKVAKAAECWLATGSVVGGISNLLFLQALKYYPFFTFGAFYSMIWHFVMVFTGCLLLVTNYVECRFMTLLYGFIFHMAFSLIVIPLDYIRDYDFMLYRSAGGVPLFSALADQLNAHGLQWLTTIMMVHVYCAAFAIIVYVTLGIKKLVGLFTKKKPQEPSEA